MIEVKNLVKQYGKQKAVDDISFTVQKGEILGFLGPNGAGKSTTMNVITGYSSATSGTVTIDGYDILEQPEEAKSRIGYLPEIPPLYPDMTVKEYLSFVADLKLMKKQNRAQEVQARMEQVKITQVQNRLIKQLSKGYKQRIGLAGALIGDPEVIILDEPTVGLDPMQMIEMRELIKQLSKEHTIILSSHILSEVSAICDKVMIINKGKLIVTDTPENLASHMSGSNRLHLVVKGEKEVVKSALECIDAIQSITFETTQEQGCVALVAESPAQEDLREMVCYVLNEVHCPIYEMQISRKSLEDIFLELTKEEQQEIEEQETEQNETTQEQEQEEAVEEVQDESHL